MPPTDQIHIVRFIWTRPAATDRRGIREYIAQNSPAPARSLDELLSQKAGRLVDNPNLGRIGHVSGIHRLAAHHNYILIYDVTDDSVRMLRVLHKARQWPC